MIRDGEYVKREGKMEGNPRHETKGYRLYKILSKRGLVILADRGKQTTVWLRVLHLGRAKER